MLKRIVLAGMAVALGLSLSVGVALAAPKKLTKKTVEQKIGQQIPGLVVLSIEPAGMGGLYEVVIDTAQGKGILYMDDKAERMIVGNMFDLNSKRNLTREKYDEYNKVPFSSIPLKDAIVLGSLEAKYKVAVFDDPE